ncbi:MAG: thermonuclease family protein [Pyrinomonadaceae bacterium]
MKTALTIFFLLTFASNIAAQRTVYGHLYHVIDGKTVVLETESHNYLTVKLQFIEVPASSEPMANVVTDHLTQLLTGKSLLFQVRRMSEFSMMNGILAANGVDISQQMLRDGAAWYSLPEKDNQNAGEREIYLKIEATAKNEKRGIWGIKDLKPYWEVNLDKQAAQNAENATAKQLTEKDNFSSKMQPKLSLCQAPQISAKFVVGTFDAQSCSGTATLVKKPSGGDIVCDGSPIPSGFLLTKQVNSADCAFYNRNGKAFVIQPNDGKNRLAAEDSVDSEPASLPSGKRDDTLSESTQNKTVNARKN